MTKDTINISKVLIDSTGNKLKSIPSGCDICCTNKTTWHTTDKAAKYIAHVLDVMTYCCRCNMSSKIKIIAA